MITAAASDRMRWSTFDWLVSLRRSVELGGGAFDRVPAWLSTAEAVDLLRALHRTNIEGTAPDVRVWTISVGGAHG